MLTYSEVPQVVNSANTSDYPVRRVTGQFVARARLNRRQRAELAATLTDGSVGVFPLTVGQAAELVRVPVPDVTRARRANGNGHGKPEHDGETLAERLARSTPAELLEAARTVGIQRVWDSMIQPVIDAEKAE